MPRCPSTSTRVDSQCLVVPLAAGFVVRLAKHRYSVLNRYQCSCRSKMSADSQPPRSIQLASSILEIVTSLENHLAENGRPACSFEPGAASPQSQLPPSLQSSVDAALGSLEELTTLLLGPMGWMTCQLARSVRDTVRNPLSFDSETSCLRLTAGGSSIW